MPVFHQHPRMELFVTGNNSSNNENHDPLAKTKIFDTDFVVKVEVDPEHTVDYELLQSMLPVVEQVSISMAMDC